MHPYRPEPSKLRPALWMPGVVCLEAAGDGEATLLVGPLAGWRIARGVEDWKRAVVLVEKSALHEHGRAPLPEERIDAARFPWLRQAALACPVVAFDPEAKSGLLAARLRVYEVQWHRVSSGGFLGVEGGGEPARGVGGEICSFPVLSIDGTPAPGEPDELSPGPTVDQILRALSDRAVCEEVELATDLLDVLDAPLAPQTDEEREHALAHWEAWLAELFARAAPLEEEARNLARALAAAPREPVIRVPFYGEAYRASRPPMVIERLAFALAAPDSGWAMKDLNLQPMD